MKSLSSVLHFPASLGPSRAGYSHGNSRKRAKSNLSEILCLSLLSAGLVKIQLKIKSLSSEQQLPHCVSTEN